jgi:type VI secretion system protein ImpF
MATINSKTRLSPPLMHVFRAASVARDARRTVDIRDQAGDRVIAGRRLRPRQVITEPVLRQEVSRDLDNLLNPSRWNRRSTLPMRRTSANRSSISAFLTSPTGRSTRPGSITSLRRSGRRSSISSRALLRLLCA